MDALLEDQTLQAVLGKHLKNVFIIVKLYNILLFIQF